MKFLVLLGDGMADYPMEALGFKTPLELARKPHVDDLCARGICGMVRTVPQGMSPGSDTANLSVMGYDPKKYYTGRAPLEAISIGIELRDNDVAYRCNLVTLSDNVIFDSCAMLDHSCDEIPSAEAVPLIQELNSIFSTERLHIYHGMSYRHCLVLNNASEGMVSTPPHDILGKPIAGYLPIGTNSAALLSIMRRSFEILKDHPINQDRKRRGKAPVSALWFWGEGRKPNLPCFYEKYKKKGAVVSAVDLIKGIGLCAGMDVCHVEGATGGLDSDFEGKAAAAIKAFSTGSDFVYLHIEAPDECGHRGEALNKVKAIEYIDGRVLAPILDFFRMTDEDYAILVLPDHPTPVSIRTHTGEPVPFILFRSADGRQNTAKIYSEKEAALSGIFIEEGHKLLEKLLFRTDREINNY